MGDEKNGKLMLIEVEGTKDGAKEVGILNNEDIIPFIQGGSEIPPLEGTSVTTLPSSLLATSIPKVAINFRGLKGFFKKAVS